MSDTLDLTTTLKLMDEARDLVSLLDGQPLNVDGDSNKQRMHRNAERSRDLLYAAHVVDLARADIISQYHRFKGAEPPEIIA